MVKPGIFIGDRYEIINKIGSGGMADVYKAKCHRLNRFVAIKILKQEFSEDKKFVDKFRAEAQSVAGLSHPNIVNVYDVGDDEGLYYIVMELVEGITLKSFIERRGNLEIKEATGIAIQVAQGIEAAHLSHMIHRDIKPQNIIISREGKVKVTDFGIAKAASSNTITSNAMGSVHYISPEQARGGYSDEKSDIYSLGVTLYEMLTGQVPFVGDNTVSVALSHIQEEAVSVRTLNPSVTASLDKIVQKCMQKKPERRYLTATALIEDLKKSIADPNGDFIQLAPAHIDDSPTISLTEDEVSTIRHAAKHNTATEEEPLKEDIDSIEEEKELDPKLEKIAIIGGSIAAVILVIIIIVLISKAFKIGKGGEEMDVSPSPSPSPVVEESMPPETEEEEIRVPQLREETREIAEAKLKELGLVAKITEQPSNMYAAGIVYDQSPVWNEVIEPGGTVEIFVSTGPEITLISVPDTVSRTLDEAKVLIAEAGLSANSADEFSDTVEAGRVIRTEPAAGTMVEQDSTVKIIYSKGKESKLTTVPNLIGLTEDQAKAKLTEAKLKHNSNIKYEKNDATAGEVFYQSHSSGTQVVEGTEISFSISLGPEKVRTYQASFTIPENPFEYEEEEGRLRVVLTQNGKSVTVFDEDIDYYSYPFKPLIIKSESDSVGEISLYIDGARRGDVYSIDFKEVTE